MVVQIHVDGTILMRSGEQHCLHKDNRSVWHLRMRYIMNVIRFLSTYLRRLLLEGGTKDDIEDSLLL